MKTESIYEWNENWEFLQKAYNNNNYKEYVTQCKNGKVVIFCSSNGLFFPNDENTFRRVVEQQDRYEWENIAKNRLILKSYEKIIFIRDIYKQWYGLGINSNTNDLKKTIDLLKKLCHGYEVTTCGVSSGGYMAQIIGIELCAHRIINLAGQWIVTSEDSDFFLHLPGENIELINKGLDLKKYFEGNVQSEKFTNTFYFFPARCNQDIFQYQNSLLFPIHSFQIDEISHGPMFRKELLVWLLICSKKKLARL